MKKSEASIIADNYSRNDDCLYLLKYRFEGGKSSNIKSLRLRRDSDTTIEHGTNKKMGKKSKSGKRSYSKK